MRKAVSKVDLNGLYIEDVEPDDSLIGVVPIYAQPEPEPEEAPELPGDVDPELPEEDTEPAPEPEREIIGYIVGIPLPTGLYHPRFDLATWVAYQVQLDEYQAAYNEWYFSQEVEPVKEAPIPPLQPDNLWNEGLTPEEIAELTKPGELSEIELLKKENMLLKAQNNAITERADFIEDIIAEMAMQIYQ
ncbi:hypothetical protein [Paenibacillus sp. FSL R10-2778]|uniref:hypothetical protein n=1 Tax=Paenibacillus sp. FSL R10-2778 TaxID=2954659 RepID=UPI003158A18E